MIVGHPKNQSSQPGCTIKVATFRGGAPNSGDFADVTYGWSLRIGNSPPPKINVFEDIPARPQWRRELDLDRVRPRPQLGVASAVEVEAARQAGQRERGRGRGDGGGGRGGRARQRRRRPVIKHGRLWSGRRTERTSIDGAYT